MKITRELKAARLLKVAETMGIDLHNFKWALITGRLDLDSEWAIMEYIGAECLSDAYYALGVAKEWLATWATVSLEELEAKGWLPKSAQATARRILKKKTIRDWC